MESAHRKAEDDDEARIPRCEVCRRQWPCMAEQIQRIVRRSLRQAGIPQ